MSVTVLTNSMGVNITAGETGYVSDFNDTQANLDAAIGRRGVWVGDPITSPPGTSDYENLKAAATYLSGVGGGILFIPPATYTLTEDYAFPAGVIPFPMPGAVFVQPWYSETHFTVTSQDTDPGTETITIGGAAAEAGREITCSAVWTTDSVCQRVRDYAGTVYITDVVTGERKRVLWTHATTECRMAQPFVTATGAGRDFLVSTNYLVASANPTSYVQSGDIVGFGATPNYSYMLCGRTNPNLYLEIHPHEVHAAGTAVKRAYRLTFTSGLVAGSYQIFTGPGVPKIIGVPEIDVSWFGLVSDGGYGGTGTDNADAFERATRCASIYLSHARAVTPKGKYSVNRTVYIISDFDFGGLGTPGYDLGGKYFTSITDRTPIFAVCRTTTSGLSDIIYGFTGGVRIGGLAISDEEDASLREFTGLLHSMPDGELYDCYANKCHCGIIFARSWGSRMTGNVGANNCRFNMMFGSALNRCHIIAQSGGNATEYGIYWNSNAEQTNMIWAYLIAQGGVGVTAQKNVYIRGDINFGEIFVYTENSEEVYVQSTVRVRVSIITAEDSTKEVDLRQTNLCDLSQAIGGIGQPLLIPPITGGNSYVGNDIDLPRLNFSKPTVDTFRKIAHDTYTAHTPYSGVPNFIGDPWFRGLQGFKSITYVNCTGALGTSNQYGKLGRYLSLTLTAPYTGAYCALELSAEIVAWWQANKYMPLLACWVCPTNAYGAASFPDLSLQFDVGAGWVDWSKSGTGPPAESSALMTVDRHNMLMKWNLLRINGGSGTLTGLRILLHAHIGGVSPGGAGNTRWTGLYFGPGGVDMERVMKGQWDYMPEAGVVGPTGGLVFPSTAAPTDTAATYVAGARVVNTAPALGGWKELVCITAGSPGVWVPDYVLADVESAKTADYNVEDDDIGTRFHNTGAAGTITGSLPSVADVAEGSCYHFTRTASQLHRIDPEPTEIIGAGGAGKYLSLDSNGASVTLMMAAGKWNVVKTYGTTSYEA